MVSDAKLTDFELYDVTQDIGESNNLAESYPELLEEMSRRLEENYRELVTTSHVWEPVESNQ